jgi:hypothetical protein
MHASEKTKHATCSGKTHFLRQITGACSGKKQLATCSGKLCLMHAVERQDTQLVVEKLNFAMEKQCVWWEKQLAASSGKLCLMHAVERQDTQLVVGKLNFATEKQCVWWEKQLAACSETYARFMQ